MTTGTFSYQEHHWECDPCGETTVGSTRGGYWGHGNGWLTRREARTNLDRHVRVTHEGRL